MRSYPIWNEIDSCAYQSRNKSYGVKEAGEVNVLVGTSARNSYEFVRHCTTHRELDNGDREYRFYVDGKCIKRRILKNKANKLTRVSAKIKNEVNS